MTMTGKMHTNGRKNLTFSNSTFREILNMCMKNEKRELREKFKLCILSQLHTPTLSLHESFFRFAVLEIYKNSLKQPLKFKI